MNYAVEINNLSKSFGALNAVDQFNLKIPENSIFGIIGPNGAGKTTLFSLLAGFLQADQGETLILGSSKVADFFGKMSILPQDARFQSNIPILEQLMFFLQLGGYSRRKAKEEIERILEIVDFTHLLEKTPATLSHGQYKRLSLAQAFLGNPRLIILDEPTTGLDYKSAKSVREYIKKLKKEATVIVSSHDMKEMRDLCDSYALIQDGKMIKTGDLTALAKERPRFRLELARPCSTTDLDNLKKLEGVESVQVQDELLIFLNLETTPMDQADLSSLLLRAIVTAGIGVSQFTYINPLEDLYARTNV